MVSKPRTIPFAAEQLNQSSAMLQAVNALDTAAYMAEQTGDKDTLIKVAALYMEMSTYLDRPNELRTRGDAPEGEPGGFRVGFAPMVEKENEDGRTE